MMEEIPLGTVEIVEDHNPPHNNNNLVVPKSSLVMNVQVTKFMT